MESHFPLRRLSFYESELFFKERHYGKRRRGDTTGQCLHEVAARLNLSLVRVRRRRFVGDSNGVDENGRTFLLGVRQLCSSDEVLDSSVAETAVGDTSANNERTLIKKSLGRSLSAGWACKVVVNGARGVLFEQQLRNSFRSESGSSGDTRAPHLGLKLMHVPDVDVAGMPEARGDREKVGLRYLGGFVAYDRATLQS